MRSITVTCKDTANRFPNFLNQTIRNASPARNDGNLDLQGAQYRKYAAPAGKNLHPEKTGNTDPAECCCANMQ